MHVVYRPPQFTDGLSNTVGVSERLQGDWLRDTFNHAGDYLLGDFAPDSVITAEQAVSLCSGLPTTTVQESRAGESWFLSGFHFTCYNHCLPPNSRLSDCSLAGTTRHACRPGKSRGGVHCDAFHRGIVNCLYMDGRVQAIRDSVDLALWRAIATRNGGEVVSTDSP